MTNEELLELLNKRFDNIENRLDKLESDIEEVKENTEITRDTVNSIVEWIDYNFSDERPFPVDTKTKKAI